MTKHEIKILLTKALIAYQEKITILAQNMAINAFLEAWAIILAALYDLYEIIRKKMFVQTATDDALDDRAAEMGVVRDANIHAGTILVFQPESTTISAIAGTAVTVSSGAAFLTGDSITIRQATGTPPLYESATIAAKPATNTLTLGAPPTYAYQAGDIILQKKLVPAGTIARTQGGITYETTEAIVTGTRTPLLANESLHMSLADKTYAKAVLPGEGSNVTVGTISATMPTIVGIKKVYNVLPGQGGAAEEPDSLLRSRIYARYALAGTDTEATLLALCQEANKEAMRAYMQPGTGVNEIVIYVAHRQGINFSAADRSHVAETVKDHSKSLLDITVENIVYTAINVSAKIGIDSGNNLNTIYAEAASRLSAFLDVRYWQWGESIDSADLLSIVNGVTGVGNVEDFTPTTDPTVASTSLPRLASLRLENIANPTEALYIQLEQGY